jgi:hypothetical protein
MVDAPAFFVTLLSSMTKKTRNWLIVLLPIPTVVVIAIVGLLIFLELQPLPPIQPLPNPNGYSDLVKAGEMVTSNVWNFDKMERAELRTTAQNNLNALQLARSGLQEECQVTLDYSPTVGTHFAQLMDMKHLAQALAAEGRLAEMENRPTDAAKSYLDVISLGNKSARGGILIDHLVGIAIEAIGTSHLQKLVDQLDAKTCRETTATLEALDAKRQTWNEVMQQESAWSHRTFTGLRYELLRLVMRNSLNKSLQTAEERFKKVETQTRQLIIDLAARAYELDKGHRPASVTNLVPDYLKAIPQDPLTGKNMVYSP